MNDSDDILFSRRQALGGGALGLAAITAPASATAARRTIVRPSRARRGDALTTPPGAIVTTRHGPVRGFGEGDSFVFKGIPYAASTAGANRFLPPQPPEPWRDPRLALTYGAICPQLAWRSENPVMRFIAWGDDRFQSEDCLNLNVWTPTLDRGARLPVLVWLHGGGFVSGSSRENAGYSGLNLSRRGAVVVTINHRVGPLGFMDLSAAGGKFASSGNAGMLDIVAALRWVQANIERFGGDPARVTIFGQSGGGAKVSALMAMPAARGTFHRAVVMSGSARTFASPDYAGQLTRAVATSLNIDARDAAGFQRADLAALIAAGAQARDIAAPGQSRTGWQPVLNRDMPVDWRESAPALSADIPMIVGSVRDEFRPLGAPPLTREQLDRQLAERFGDQAAALLASLHQSFPMASPTDLSAAVGGLSWRDAAIVQASSQASARKAPVFHYYYTLPSPLLDGAIGVPHGADVDPFFDNVEHQPALTGRRPEAFDLAEKMSGALIAFAATGRPDHGRLGWTAFDPARVNTMILDARPRMVDDPVGAARRIAVAMAKPGG